MSRDTENVMKSCTMIKLQMNEGEMNSHMSKQNWLALLMLHLVAASWSVNSWNPACVKVSTFLELVCILDTVINTSPEVLLLSSIVRQAFVIDKCNNESMKLVAAFADLLLVRLVHETLHRCWIHWAFVFVDEFCFICLPLCFFCDILSRMADEDHSVFLHCCT